MRDTVATKIVSTLVPATTSEDMIRKLFKAGVTMFRINSSHDVMETHASTLAKIRKIEQEEKEIIPVLLDLQGPKIRIGELDEPIKIKTGEILKFKHQNRYENNIIPVDYKGIAEDVRPNEKILIDDGKIQLIVEKIENHIVYAKVLTTGEIKPRKGLNIPGGTGSIDILTERDKLFVDFAIKNDIDYLGLSFVRNKEDILKLRKILNKNNSDLRIISKIEKPQALENIDEIIEHSDGIMVARGDLGIEIETERLPIAQKTIIRKANMARKPVIVATQMLESMIENPIPTRAETSDVANAIIDGTDAIMLSGETAMGAYPIEAVNMMQKIATTVEHSSFTKKNKFPKKMVLEEKNSQAMAIGMSIADMTEKMRIKAVVALTGSGFTPIFLAKGRLSVPIFAFCPRLEICSAIKLYRGVFPTPLTEYGYNNKIDKESLNTLDNYLINTRNMKDGDLIVITGCIPEILKGGTNFIKIHRIGSERD